MDEIDEEAKQAKLQRPKTGANWDKCAAGLFMDLCVCPERKQADSDDIAYLFHYCLLVLRRQNWTLFESEEYVFFFFEIKIYIFLLFHLS